MVSLSELCSSAAARYETTFSQAGIRFRANIAPGIPVTGDDTLFMQMLANLLDNAVKYSGGSAPLVTLLLRREDPLALLGVENTYEGTVTPEDLERLFEPYYRHDQRTGSGVGLGLAIVRKIVTLHGGDITAERTRTGILFLVRLPLLASKR